MPKQKLLIATHNKGKLELFKHYLRDLNYEIISLDDAGITHDVEETGTTYEENAALKARTYADMSGLLTLGDDGGIEIEALGGEPGLYSSRYAGYNKTDKEKVEFILDKLKFVPADKRQTVFVVVLALANPHGAIQYFRGELKGRMIFEPRGTPRNQLPYRQIFIPDGYNLTLDELDDQGISYNSHRQKAIEKMIKALK